MSSEYRIERWTGLAAPNAAMLRLRMKMEGYSVFQWADHPGTFYGPHKHETFQSHWVISGRLELTVAGRGTFELGPGDRDFMPANTYHTAEVRGEEAVVYLIGELNEVQKPKRSRKSTKTAAPKRKTTRSKQAVEDTAETETEDVLEAEFRKMKNLFS